MNLLPLKPRQHLSEPRVRLSDFGLRILRFASVTYFAPSLPIRDIGSSALCVQLYRNIRTLSICPDRSDIISLMKYAILLRGVNVGGNRRVPNTEFRQVLESLGFTDVVTYINSGNAVGSHTNVPSRQEVEKALEAHFKFTIPTLIVPGPQIQAIAAAIPASWTNDMPKPDKSGNKSDVLYLFEELDTPDAPARLAHNPAIEQMLYVKGAVITTVTRKNQAKYSLLKVVGTGLYGYMTIRNVNTARKLAELVR